jgi:hypothetical protein
MAFLSASANAGRPANKQPYTWGKLSIGSSTTSVQLNGVNELDAVTLTSILLSGDPNENGEGENLVWASGAHDDGGKLTQYWTPVQQRFLASSNNPHFSAGIVGADGDESASIQIDVDPAPPPQSIPDDVKDAARVNASNAENNASALGTAGKVCKALTDAGQLQMKNLCKFISQSQKVEETWGQVLGEIANDPSDPNFRAIALPVAPVITRVPAGDVPQPIADAFNALVDNQLQSIGVMRAIITSTNRATGAYDANEDGWMAAQAAAGIRYRAELAVLIQKKVALLANLQAALRTGGVPAITVTANDVFEYELDLLNYGFSSDEIQMYTELGYSADDIEMARKRLAMRDIFASAGTFPEKFTSQDYTNALQNLTKLLQFVPLGADQGILAQGTIDSGTGSIVTFSAMARMEGDKLVGNVQAQDHATANSFGFRSTSLTSAGTQGNNIVIDGNYAANDKTTGTFHLVMTRDGTDIWKGSLKIQLSNGIVLGGTLRSGFIDMPKIR